METVLKDKVLKNKAPSIRKFLWGLGALLLALVAQQRLQSNAITEASVFYALALLLFLLAFVRTVSPTGFVAPISGVIHHSRYGWLWRVLPLVGAVGLAVLALRTFDEKIELPATFAWQLYAASIGLALVGALLLDWGAAPVIETEAASRPGQMPTYVPQGGRWLLLLLILALAAFVRLWHFHSLPFGVWYDEATNALQTLHFQAIPNTWPIMDSSSHQPGHYLWFIELAFRWLGVNIYAVRTVSVVMGLLMVLAGYLVGAELWGSAMGLVLAFLLAIGRWAVNISRFGMYNVSTPLCALLTIGFLLRGLRRGRYVDFALAGLSFGFGFCIYAAFQLFVGVVFLFLLAMSFLERGFLRRHWSGLVLMIGMALLVAAPMLLFAREEPQVYFARTKETSLWASTKPAERWPALLENVRKHVLMFNYQGDPNGRHNLPGAPMLDPYTAALLVLGLGLALWRWRQPRYLLLFVWLGIMLLGGILSLDFEAPQSLRAIGTLPAAYLLAVVPLDELWRAWRREGGRYYPNFVVTPLLLLLVGLGYNNFYTYFYRQANDFAVWNAYSTPETIAAKLLTSLDDQTEAYVISYFDNHPTLNFMARNIRPYHRLETTDHLPLPWSADKNVALIIDADSRTLFDEAKRLYPHAKFQEFQPPFGGPTVVYYALLPRADLASIQGLTGQYYANAQWQGAPVQTHQDTTLNFDWAAQPPLAQPFSVEWSGVLDVATYGLHQFLLQAPGHAELYIDEQQVLTGTGQTSAGLLLAQGNHALRVRAVGGAGPLRLQWRPPDREAEVIPATVLYVPPVTSNGLLGNYYANAQWQGPAALARIDSQLNMYFHIIPLPRPYTVEWVGKIAIPQGGTYHFGLESIDESTLWIDQQQVTEGRLPNVYQENTIDLTQGLHDLRVRFSDHTGHTHINLYWTPPGGGQQIIPTDVLFPPQGSYERVQLPDLAALAFNPPSAGAANPTAQSLPGVIRLMQQGLSQPRGIAAGPDGRMYVADTGNHRLLILSPEGEVLKSVTQGSEPFVEPFDVAVAAKDQVYLLDATLGRLIVLNGDGVYQRDLPADKTLLEHARGIHVDQQGRVWVANTSGERIAALDDQGAITLNVPIGAGAQPVDVAVAKNGLIFATDSGLNKLSSFDPNGRRLLAWDIPVANSMDGAHLAAGTDDFVYMTEPEKSNVVKLSAQGERLGLWTLTGPNGALVKPIGLAVDPTGRIWVVDVAGGNVFLIEPKG